MNDREQESEALPVYYLHPAILLEWQFTSRGCLCVARLLRQHLGFASRFNSQPWSARALVATSSAAANSKVGGRLTRLEPARPRNCRA